MDDKDLFSSSSSSSSSKYSVSRLHAIKLTTSATMLREKVLENSSKRRPYLVKEWHPGIIIIIIIIIIISIIIVIIITMVVHVAGWLKHKCKLNDIPTIVLRLKLTGNDIMTMDSDTIIKSLNSTNTNTSSTANKELMLTLQAIASLKENEKTKNNYKFDSDYVHNTVIPDDNTTSTTNTKTAIIASSNEKKSGIKTSSSAITSVVGDSVKSMFKKKKLKKIDNDDNDDNDDNGNITNDTNSNVVNENKNNIATSYIQSNDESVLPYTDTINSQPSIIKTDATKSTVVDNIISSSNINENATSISISEEKIPKEVSYRDTPHYIPTISSRIINTYCSKATNIIRCYYDDEGNSPYSFTTKTNTHTNTSHCR